jgi:hypothetical protein
MYLGTTIIGNEAQTSRARREHVRAHVSQNTDRDLREVTILMIGMPPAGSRPGKTGACRCEGLGESQVAAR